VVAGHLRAALRAGRVLGDDRQDLDRGGRGRTVVVLVLQRLRAVMSPWGWWRGCRVRRCHRF
jgi:hypothetical protein